VGRRREKKRRRLSSLIDIIRRIINKRVTRGRCVTRHPRTPLLAPAGLSCGKASRSRVVLDSGWSM
jgi:hypothetical protein